MAQDYLQIWPQDWQVWSDFPMKFTVMFREFLLRIYALQ
jgi:hypothetical protein